MNGLILLFIIGVLTLYGASVIGTWAAQADRGREHPLLMATVVLCIALGIVAAFACAAAFGLALWELVR